MSHTTEDHRMFKNPYYYRTASASTIKTKYLGKNAVSPYQKLKTSIKNVKKMERPKYGKAIAHMFDKDLRLKDNTSLSAASKLASENNIHLVCIYVMCEEDLFAHNIGSFQVEFRVRLLKGLKEKLEAMNIPLVVLNSKKTKDKLHILKEFLKKFEIRHIFANIEYEIDELRFLKSATDELIKDNIILECREDICVVNPGKLLTKSKNTPYTVFTPWYKSWCKYINENEDVLRESPAVKPNSTDCRTSMADLFLNFDITIPSERVLDDRKCLIFTEKYECNEESAWDFFEKFLSSGKIDRYHLDRSSIDSNASSQMSPYFASGVIPLRAVIRQLLKKNIVQKVDSGSPGAVEWIRQLAWRDFYRQILVHWPHICMFKPFDLDYEELDWDYSEVNFSKWSEGKTGYPIVDASMRKLNETGSMNNRCRMIVASFLAKHLLIDWRFGEYYFMEHLLDADFASNNGGWSFCASVGADCQPYFRVFNPWTQSKKFDSKGNFIRKWVPELKSIEDEEAIHNPYNSRFADVAKREGYPRPIIEHEFARRRALEKYGDVKRRPKRELSP